jgi:hypothetical protein
MLCAAFCARPAAAAPAGALDRVAILDVEALEGAPPATAEALSQVLGEVGGASKAWRTLPDIALTVAEARLTFGCLDNDPACWSEVGRALGADLLVFGVAWGVPEGVATKVYVHDVRTERQARVLSRTFLPTDLKAAFGRALAEFLGLTPGAPDTERTVLRVVVEPDGADVFFDTAYLGATPIPEQVVLPGRHEVVIRRRGHKSWRRSMEMSPGETIDVRVTLPRLVGPPHSGAVASADPYGSDPAARRAGTGRSGFSRRFLGWGALGAGAAVAGIGVVFGILERNVESEYDQPEVPQARAHALADTGESYAAAANLLYGVGAALVVTGAIIVAFSPPGERERQATGALMLLPSGGGAMWTWGL